MSPDSLYDRDVAAIPPDEAAALLDRTADCAVERPVACPVCGDDHPRPRFRIDGLPNLLWDCPRCGLGWMHPPPTEAQIAEFYPPVYYGDSGAKFRGLVEWAVRFVGSRHLRFLTAHLPRGAAVLDIGCGRGVLLRELADRGYRAFGTERSADASLGTDSRAEIRICSHLGEAGFASGYFDQIILWHVLEHLSDPAATLDEMHRILSDSGTVVIAVPNYSSWQARWSGPAWFHLDAPRHLFHFSIESLERLLRDRGFVVRSRHHFSLRQNPFGWVQSILNRWSSQPRNALYAWLLRRRMASGERASWGQRAGFAVAFVVGMPVATVLEAAATLFRRGGTVHVVAEKARR